MPAVEQIHDFLRSLYKHDRFEGRNRDDGIWADYSGSVARSTLAHLAQHGWSVVANHESATGNAVWFNAALEIAEPPF